MPKVEITIEINDLNVICPTPTDPVGIEESLELLEEGLHVWLRSQYPDLIPVQITTNSRLIYPDPPQWAMIIPSHPNPSLHWTPVQILHIKNKDEIHFDIPKTGRAGRARRGQWIRASQNDYESYLRAINQIP